MHPAIDTSIPRFTPARALALGLLLLRLAR
jgi:hypothetical protein